MHFFTSHLALALHLPSLCIPPPSQNGPISTLLSQPVPCRDSATTAGLSPVPAGSATCTRTKETTALSAHNFLFNIRENVPQKVHLLLVVDLDQVAAGEGPVAGRLGIAHVVMTSRHHVHIETAHLNRTSVQPASGTPT